MAIIGNSLIAKAKGSIGGVTFRRGKGGSTIASEKITHTTVVNSEGQVRQKTRFTVLISVLSLITGTLRNYFKPLKATHSGYNSATSVNALKMNEMDLETIADLCPEMQVTRGDTYSVPFTLNQAQSNPLNGETQRIALNYVDTSENGQGAATDIVHVLYVNPTSGLMVAHNTNARRSDGEALSQCPIQQDGLTYCYAFFVDAVTGEASNSQFIAEIPTAGLVFGD